MSKYSTYIYSTWILDICSENFQAGLVPLMTLRSEDWLVLVWVEGWGGVGWTVTEVHVFKARYAH